MAVARQGAQHARQLLDLAGADRALRARVYDLIARHQARPTAIERGAFEMIFDIHERQTESGSSAVRPRP